MQDLATKVGELKQHINNLHRGVKHYKKQWKTFGDMVSTIRGITTE